MIAVAEHLVLGHWLTPPQVARERGIRTGKVLAWITSGELAAVNHATRMGGRPRWRISRAALDAFDAARSSVASKPRQSHARRSNADSSVISFY